MRRQGQGADSQWTWEILNQGISPSLLTLYSPLFYSYILQVHYFVGQRVEAQRPHPKQPLHKPNKQDMDDNQFEAFQHKFLDDIIKLVKQQNDAEDAENARHTQRINAINAQYEEQLVALRARHASRRDEFLQNELQALQQHYQQAAMDHYPNSGTAPADPYSCPASGAEGYQTYNSDHYNSYKERAHFLGGPRDHSFEPRGPYPGGRVYDTGSRYY